MRSHSREGGSLDVPGLDDNEDDHDHDDGSSEASVVSPQRSREEGAASRTYDDANATCSTKPEALLLSLVTKKRRNRFPRKKIGTFMAGIGSGVLKKKAGTHFLIGIGNQNGKIG